MIQRASGRYAFRCDEIPRSAGRNQCAGVVNTSSGDENTISPDLQQRRPELAQGADVEEQMQGVQRTPRDVLKHRLDALIRCAGEECDCRAVWEQCGRCRYQPMSLPEQRSRYREQSTLLSTQCARMPHRRIFGCVRVFSRHVPFVFEAYRRRSDAYQSFPDVKHSPLDAKHSWPDAKHSWPDA